LHEREGRLIAEPYAKAMGRNGCVVRGDCPSEGLGIGYEFR